MAERVRIPIMQGDSFWAIEISIERDIDFDIWVASGHGVFGYGHKKGIAIADWRCAYVNHAEKEWRVRRQLTIANGRNGEPEDE